MRCERILVAVGVCLLAWHSSLAEAPGVMNYQGRLVENGELVNAPSLSLTLRIYDAPSAGTLLYEDSGSVTVVDGLYSTVIGDNRTAGTASDLAEALRTAGTNAWLGVTVGGGAELTPRDRLLAAPYTVGLGSLAYKQGAAFVIVETTTDDAANGRNLLAAYAAATNMMPHGMSRSAENRVTVIVPPGRYNLQSNQVEMTEEFIDLIGLTTSRDDQRIFGTSSGPGTGVIRQTADDVRIENLSVECTRASGTSGPAAYFPDSARSNTVVRNCSFLANDLNAHSMRGAIEYAGVYEQCSGGEASFGYSGEASGTFADCTGGVVSFGYFGVASGAFTDCTGGTGSFGGNGTASGRFTDCTGGMWSFGGGPGA